MWSSQRKNVSCNEDSYINNQEKSYKLEKIICMMSTFKLKVWYNHKCYKMKI